ncbi:lysophospholipid acyltransferase family protein [Terrihabitans sp. B22-R8]|uniref:lysophospholipid acyltransferase family protein n=1 Tax=Terrihabitans sp. B22-R8 TaxID=3425128 RepID=UPI00403CFB04
MIALRSLVFNAVFYGSFLGLAVLGLPMLLVPDGAQKMARVWARMNLWTLRHVAGIRVDFRGLENLPREGCLIAAKHQSELETFGMVPVIGPFAFILKQELNRIPVFGWYTTRAGMIGVDRSAGASALRQMVADGRAALDAGRKVVIFPEGTRRPPGAEPDYKPGIAQLYTKLGTACVPVAVNTGLFWPRSTWLRYPGTAVVEFLPPIEPGLDGRSFRTVLQDVLETNTDRLVAEARARREGIPADRLDPAATDALP